MIIVIRTFHFLSILTMRSRSTTVRPSAGYFSTWRITSHSTNADGCRVYSLIELTKHTISPLAYARLSIAHLVISLVRPTYFTSHYSVYSKKSRIFILVVFSLLKFLYPKVSGRSKGVLIAH